MKQRTAKRIRDASNLRRAPGARWRRWKPDLLELRATLKRLQGEPPQAGNYKNRHTPSCMVMLAFDSDCGQENAV